MFNGDDQITLQSSINLNLIRFKFYIDIVSLLENLLLFDLPPLSNYLIHLNRIWFDFFYHIENVPRRCILVVR